MYLKIILDKQEYKPKTALIDISGNKHTIEISNDEVDKTFNETQKLKHNINNSFQKKKINGLANPDKENCFMCNYRSVCNAYRQKFMNFPLKNNIDICGKVTLANNSLIKIENNQGVFQIVNLIDKIPIIDKNICVYNLYFLDIDNKILYTQNNTIVKYE